jgi:hypothetical protein
VVGENPEIEGRSPIRGSLLPTSGGLKGPLKRYGCDTAELAVACNRRLRCWCSRTLAYHTPTLVEASESL